MKNKIPECTISNLSLNHHHFFQRLIINLLLRSYKKKISDPIRNSFYFNQLRNLRMAELIVNLFLTLVNIKFLFDQRDDT